MQTPATFRPAALPFALVRQPALRYTRHLGHCAQCARQFSASSSVVVCDVPKLHPMLGVRYCSEQCAHERIDASMIAGALEYMQGCREIIVAKNAQDPRLPELDAAIARHACA